MPRRLLSLLVLSAALTGGETPPPLEPIRTVTVGENGEFRVNGRPFLPIISWLQNASTYPRLRGLGFNTFMGNWEKQPPADAMAAKAQAAGGYAIPHWEDGKAAGHPGILAWFDQDEPDLSHMVSDAVVEAGAGLRLNKKAPLTNLVDGKPGSAAALDPLAGAAVTVVLKAPVTVASLAVTLTPGEEAASTATELVFLGDGRELLTTAVEPRKGQQKLPLPAPATFSRLEMRVSKATAGKAVWGQVNEIEAFDAQGANLLKSEPRPEVGRRPAASKAAYDAIKAGDPARPALLTLTCRFLPNYERWHKLPAEEMRAMYPQWAAATDALGTDIYPIYGFAKPEWLLDNVAALKAMRGLAGPRKPLYIWIECCDGGAQQGDELKVLPRHTRAEVWMSLIAGARAIGYFTHAFKPKLVEFAPGEAMQAEMRRLNLQLDRLAPAILAKPVAGAGIAFTDGIAGHVLATATDDATWVFAQNLDLGGRDALGGRAGKGTVRLPGLKAGTKIEVVDENRSLTAEDGAFSDDFAALAEHVYRLAR